MKRVNPDPVSLEKTGIPDPAFGTHYASQDVAFSFSLSPQETRSAGCPSRTPESCDSQPSHPLVTKDAIPAFLENIKVWVPRTSALQAPGVSLLGPALSRPRWGAVACRALLPTQPCSSLPGLLSAGVSASLTTSSVLDPDPWVSATGPALAPASPSGPTPFLFSPGDLLPESEYGPWRSLKVSLHRVKGSTPESLALVLFAAALFGSFLAGLS